MDVNVPWGIPTSCAASDLSKQLKRAFMRPEIGQLQSVVRLEDDRHIQALNIEALAHHLGPYHDIDLPLFEPVDKLSHGGFFPGAIRINAEHTGLREELFDRFLYPLGPEPPPLPG